MLKKQAADNRYALVRRSLSDDDIIDIRLRVVITDVPSAITANDLKQLVDSVGNDLLEGIRGVEYDEEIDWRNGYKLIPDSEWDGALQSQVENIHDRSHMTDQEIHGVRVAIITELGTIVIVDDDTCILNRIVSYSDLVDHLSGEKRITLRLPRGLHSRLARKAYESVSSSLNAYCVQTLADAVGYEDLAEFEAQKRKPGRPKKAGSGK